jgi:ABC-type nitrate/sulfonate/bicarbonate transport system permease component
LGKYSAPLWVLIYFILWILLSEIILPVNNIFPKPSIVLQSLFDLIKTYELGLNYLSTVSAIYFPLILAYYLCYLIFPIVSQKGILADIILSLEWFSRYIPGVILAMILIYWFPQSEFTKFIFTFLISLTSLMFKSKNLAENFGSEYSIALQSFGIGKNVILSKVIWKAIQPELTAHIIKKNLYLWASVIIFEYVNLGFGLGTLLRKILQFKDLSALVMTFIIIGTSIFLSNQLLEFIKSKFYFWKA